MLIFNLEKASLDVNIYVTKLTEWNRNKEGLRQSRFRQPLFSYYFSRDRNTIDPCKIIKKRDM